MRDLYLGIAIVILIGCLVYYHHRMIGYNLMALWYYITLKRTNEGFEDTSSEYYTPVTTLYPESNASCGRLSNVYQFVNKHYTESSSLSEKINDSDIHNCLSRAIDHINILKKHMETISSDEQADSSLTNKELDDIFNNIQMIRTYIMRNRLTT
jgi:hypothetical protein